MPPTSPTMLIILDGFGISSKKIYNAVFQAKTPHLDKWKLQYAYTALQAAGKSVGLPTGYNGNSEVGHFAIGSGRIIKQTSTLLNYIMQQSSLQNSTILTNLLKNFNQKRKVHLLGLASDGNIHSNIDHLRSLIFTLNYHKITNFLIHAFLDGRDTAPHSAQQFLNIIESDLQKYQCGKIASIHGRFYAMDRNKNFDRTQKTFDILTKQQKTFIHYKESINKNYTHGLSDEFLIPTACIADHTIQPGDGVIFFNFRPDRAIQITEKLLTLDLAFLVTPINYHPTLQTTTIIKNNHADETLLETLSTHKKTIFTIAETEKYAHVTYFFNGNKDIIIPGEQRILVSSLTTQDITKNPNMRAQQITQHVLTSLQTNPKDFYLINYANADMVGHSGNLDATIAAIECLDTELNKLYEEVVIKQHGTIYITADHGNAEIMYDETSNQPYTSHTDNPVPFYMLTNNKIISLDKLHGLADIAPFVLENMGVEVPEIMKK